MHTVAGPLDEVLSRHVVVLWSSREDLWQSTDPTRTVPQTGRDSRRPTPWTPSPSTGDPLPKTRLITRHLRIEEGSRLAGPVRLDVPGNDYGTYALLEVTGDPDVVLDRYVAQLTEEGLVTPGPSVESLDGAKATTVFLDEAGGDVFRLSLVEREGRPPWLVVQAGHD